MASLRIKPVTMSGFGWCIAIVFTHELLEVRKLVDLSDGSSRLLLTQHARIKWRILR